MDLDPHSAVGARNRAIVKIVVGLAAAGVVIGLLTGLAGAGAMRAIGFKPDQTPPPASVAPPTGESPETTGTTGSTPASEPTSTPSPDEGGGSGDNKGKDKDKDDQKPSLEASPAQVGAGERISLSGSFPALGEGEVLQVQR
ncbi:MAG: hypothetical protein ACRDO8_00065, partial [Nocardioidaceae bacterium]